MYHRIATWIALFLGMVCLLAAAIFAWLTNFPGASG